MGGSNSTVLKQSPALRLQTPGQHVLDLPEGKYWTGDPHETVEVRLTLKGLGATQARTMHAIFKLAAKKHGKKVALRQERNSEGLPPKTGSETQGITWKTWTWQEYYDETVHTAKAFLALGLKPRDGVCIHGFNSPEWVISETGTILGGGVSAGIYPTDNLDQVFYKARHSGSVIACCEGEKQANNFITMAKEGRLPKMRAVVYWQKCASLSKTNSFTNPDGVEVQVLHWGELAAWAAKTPQATYDAIENSVQPGNCCALVYTSGTTGNAKAVMLSHDNVIYECATMYESILNDGPDGKAILARTEPLKILSYLPLSHVAGLLFDIVSPINGTALVHPVEMTFARPTDMKEGTLKFRIQNTRPSFFLGVPRVWEKIQEAILAQKAENPPGACTACIIDSAKSSGIVHSRNQQLGRDGSGTCCHCLWDKLVYKKVKHNLGLDDCIFAMTGAAPIQVSTLDFFGQLGLTINDCYGMSECTGAATVSTNAAHVTGSCGYALRGTEVAVMQEKAPGVYTKAPPCPTSQFDEPPEKYQGELCFRGRGVMMGYMINPDLGEEHVAELEGKNSEAIDRFGWLHSGDKGTMDARGMYRITGRYKELIITAGGENIAPVPIEGAIKEALGGQGGVLSNVMMIGDKRKYNVAFVTLTAVGSTGEKPGTEELAGGAKHVSHAATIPEAMSDPAFRDKITAAIVKVNKNGHVCPSAASRVQKFTILPRDFSSDTEELTATLKVRRSVVEKKYAAILEKMYSPEVADMNYVPFEA